MREGTAPSPAHHLLLVLLVLLLLAGHRCDEGGVQAVAGEAVRGQPPGGRVCEVRRGRGDVGWRGQLLLLLCLRVCLWMWV